MSKFSEIRCPFCHRKKSVIHNLDTLFCTKCFRHFDDDPDEGGDYCDDPTKRIEWMERKMERRRTRR